jgi:putative transposase
MFYIEMNPVRAGLVARPEEYRWSSFGANALGYADALVTPHPFYYALGRTPAERQAAYRALFQGGVLRQPVASYQFEYDPAYCAPN